MVIDNTGDPENAYTHIAEAMNLDPLDPNIDRSFKIVCGRLRAKLLEAAPGDAAIPRLYRLLVNAHRVDEACHLAAAKHYDASGDVAEAIRVADALTVLSPAYREAWAFRAALARKVGDMEGAMRAEVEADACEAARVFRRSGQTPGAQA